MSCLLPPVCTHTFIFPRRALGISVARRWPSNLVCQHGLPRFNDTNQRCSKLFVLEPAEGRTKTFIPVNVAFGLSNHLSKKTLGSEGSPGIHDVVVCHSILNRQTNTNRQDTPETALVHFLLPPVDACTYVGDPMVPSTAGDPSSATRSTITFPTIEKDDGALIRQGTDGVSICMGVTVGVFKPC